MKKNMISIGVMTGILVASVLGIYWVKGIYPFGNTTMAWGDMGQETLPLYYYLHDILTGKSNPSFSWQVAAGNNMSGVAAEWSLLSPLNLLLLLTSKENIYNFVSILLLFKMVCMALTMYAFSGYYKIEHFYRVILSLLYAVCACVLVHYQIGFMIDIAVIFPLLMLGLYRLLEKDRLLLYVGSLALILIVNIYIGVMALIYVFLASGLYIYLNVNGTKKPRTVWRLAWGTAISMMIGAFVWYPTVLHLMSSGRMEKDGIMGWIGTYILACKYHWSEDDWHYTHFFLMNACFLLAVILLRLRKKFWCLEKERYHRWLSGLMLLPLMIPGTEILWHMGSRVCWPVRFAFMITFTLIEYVCYILETSSQSISQSEGEKRSVKTGLVVFIGIGYCAAAFASAYDFGQTEILVLVGGGILILTQMYVLARYRGKWKKGLICVLIFAEALGNMKLWLAPSFLTEQESVAYLPQSSEAGNGHDFSSNPLERTKNYYGILDCNYAFPMGANSISNFIHIIPSSRQDAMEALGYSINYTKLLDNGGTIFTDALMGMEYVFSDTEMDPALYIADEQQTEGDIFWYKSRYVLPTGVYMDRDPEKTDDVFDYQNEIFQVLTNSGEDLIQKAAVDGYGHASITVDGSCAIYFYGNVSERVRISVNGNPLRIGNGRGVDQDDWEYPTDYNNGLVCLGVFDDEKVEIQFSSMEKTDDSELRLGILDLDKLADSLEEIQKNTNTEVWTGTDFIEADCETQDFTYLFLPVAYDDGWKAVVNGKETEIHSFLGGFMAVPLEAGKNQIRISYMPPGTTAGRTLTFLGILLLAIWLLLRKWKKQCGLSALEKGVYYVHMWCFRIFVAAFYVLPAIGYTFVLIVLTLNKFFPFTQHFTDYVAGILDHFRSRY